MKEFNKALALILIMQMRNKDFVACYQAKERDDRKRHAEVRENR